MNDFKYTFFLAVIFEAIFLTPLLAQTSTSLKTAPSLKENSSNINDQKSAGAGISVPVDDGRGYPAGYGFFLWKRSAWPWPSTDFKLTMAGINGDAELIHRGLIASDTDLGYGFNYQTLGRFEEYHQGQIDIGNRMETNKASGRLFLQQHVISNYAEIAQIRAAYEFGYEDYSREDDTSPTFTLAPSSFFQTLKLHGGTGKLTRSNYSPKGWNLNFGAEATFRDDWSRWGPPNLWDSPSEFQKFQIDGSYVALSIHEQKLVTKFSGGIGNGLDRLSAYKLGSSLTGTPHSLVLHGFYTREIFAEDYELLNFDYVMPLLKDQQLAWHLYFDEAITQRSDIPDNQAHVWFGSGTGISFKGYGDIHCLIGYGYGINAPRGSDHGGHEIFAQMSKQF